MTDLASFAAERVQVLNEQIEALEMQLRPLLVERNQFDRILAKTARANTKQSLREIVVDFVNQNPGITAKKLSELINAEYPGQFGEKSVMATVSSLKSQGAVTRQKNGQIFPVEAAEDEVEV